MGKDLHVGVHVGVHVGTRWWYTLVHVGARCARWCTFVHVVHVGTRCARWYTLVHVGVHVCARCQKTESFVTDGVLKRECGGGSCGVSYASTKVWIS